MTELSEEDWTLVNAYHDGELPAAERQALERRLAAEPALAEALSCVRQLSEGLAGLRPSMSASAGRAAPRLPSQRPVARLSWRAFAAGALAASIGAAALFVGLQRSPDSATAVHAAFLAQRFPVDESRFRQAAASGGELPDLAAARLALVATRALSGGIAIHYAGMNNCRLTFFDTARPVALRRRPGLRSDSWQAGGRHYAAVAVGMDPARFEAIAAFLRRFTDPAGEHSARLALAKEGRKGGSCNSGKRIGPGSLPG